MKKNVLQLIVWVLIVALAVAFEPPKAAQSADPEPVKSIEIKPFLEMSVSSDSVKIEKGESQYQKEEKEKLASISKTSSTVKASSPSLSLDELRALYAEVQSETGTPAKLVESVHQVESGKSSSCKVSYASAMGPFQFLKSTFAHYSKNGNICNVRDSAFAAGRLLAANGASSGDIDSALFSYNHSWSYVAKVKSVMNSI